MSARPTVLNPWSINLRQADALDALCTTGEPTEAAKRLKLSRNTVNDYLNGARRKMGVNNSTLAALMWDRWRQGPGKDVPA